MSSEEKKVSYLDVLEKKLVEIAKLKVPVEQRAEVEHLFGCYTLELSKRLSICSEEIGIKKSFGPYVRNILSVVEVVVPENSNYKALKRLLCNEIYSCQDQVAIPSLLGKEANRAPGK